MQQIFVRSFMVALASVAASLAIVATIVPAIGGVVDGNAWLMCALCPLLIGWPASAHAMWRKRQLHQAHEALQQAHADLAVAHAKLAEKARRDDMTGMLNRESFFQVVEAGRRKHATSALLIVDADHFKTINDGFGHQTGDEALLEITGAICRAAGKDGTIGRIGGEEFGVFVPGAVDGKARLVGERIRREVERITFKDGEGRRIPLTVSIGAAVAQPETPLAELMREADRRLYEAKRRGRNRVVHEGELSKAA